jgi:hypothetical protein
MCAIGGLCSLWASGDLARAICYAQSKEYMSRRTHPRGCSMRLQRRLGNILLPYRVVVKLRRRTFGESMLIAKSMCELSDEEAGAVARRANGVPGTIRTLCGDVRTARRFGYDTLKFIDEAPLPRQMRVNTYYLLLGMASVLLSLRYILYHYKLYGIGYDVAILAYMIYSVMRFRRVVY